MPSNEIVSSSAARLLTFSSLTLRPKNSESPSARPAAEARNDDGTEIVGPADPTEPAMADGVHDQLWDLTFEDGFCASEEFLESLAGSRVRRRQASKRKAGGDRALRKTAAGRVGKAWKTSYASSVIKKTRHKKHASVPGERTRRLLPARQFLRRRQSASSGGAPLLAPVPPDDVWEAIQAIPGFAFDGLLPTDVARRLGQVLADPTVVCKCGRSPKRRRLPHLVIMMLTFPIQAHHGRGTFEQDCGYMPGEEHSPAFWKRFAGAFTAWLGLNSSSSEDWFDGGVVLQELVTLFSSARVRFLYQFHNQPATESTRRRDSTLGSKTPRHRRRNTIIDTGEDDDNDENEDGDDDDDYMADDGNTSAETKPVQPTQIQRRVSIAADAWLMFLDKSRGADFDPEMLAELCI